MIDADAVRADAVESLGLGTIGVNLTSREAISASLRRAASFLCPATSGRIVRAVLEVMAGLVPNDDDLRRELDATLDLLIASGDLLYLPTGDGGSMRRLFLGPPSFVQRSANAFILVGVRPDGAPFVDDELAPLITYEGHTRTLRMRDALDGAEILGAADIARLTKDQWVRAPRSTLASEVLAYYTTRLLAAGTSSGIAELQLLDPATPVRYYRGRWRTPMPADNGTYVARRPQAYGADLWCVAVLAGGQVVRFVDLPVDDRLSLARDEAWRLQAALDATLGHPQQLRIREGQQADVRVLDLFSPVPSWAQRYLDAVGVPLGRSGGSLFSYGLAVSDVDEITAFLSAGLWLATADE